MSLTWETMNGMADAARVNIALPQTQIEPGSQLRPPGFVVGSMRLVSFFGLYRHPLAADRQTNAKSPPRDERCQSG